MLGLRNPKYPTTNVSSSAPSRRRISARDGASSRTRSTLLPIGTTRPSHAGPACSRSARSVKIAAWLDRASSRLAASRAGPAFGKRYGTRKSWNVVTTRALGSVARSSEGSRCTEPPEVERAGLELDVEQRARPEPGERPGDQRKGAGVPALDDAVDGHLALAEDAPGRDARPLAGEDAERDAERRQGIAQARV